MKVISLSACSVGCSLVSCLWLMRWHYGLFFTHGGKWSLRYERQREKKNAAWTSELMLTGISAGSEEGGVAVWCIGCHHPDSYTRTDERGLKLSRTKKKKKKTLDFQAICFIDVVLKLLSKRKFPQDSEAKIKMWSGGLTGGVHLRCDRWITGAVITPYYAWATLYMRAMCGASISWLHLPTQKDRDG